MLVIDIVEVGADRQWAVVGVRPIGDVLVPLDLLATFGPFKVELRVVKFYIGPDEVGNDIGEDGL